MRKILLIVLVCLVVGGCAVDAVNTAIWTHHADTALRPYGKSNRMSDAEVADRCIQDGMELISKGKREHACGMFKQAAENGRPKEYRTYCDYNWKPRKY